MLLKKVHRTHANCKHTHTHTHRKTHRSIIGNRVACRAAPRSTRKPNPPFLIKRNLRTKKQQQKLRCKSFFFIMLHPVLRGKLFVPEK